MKEKENLSTRKPSGGGVLSKLKNLDGKKKIYLGVLVISLITLIVGVSYAYIAYTAKQTSTNTIGTSCVKVTLSDVTNPISLDKAYPLKDSEAEQLTPYTFKIENNCDTPVTYKVDLDVLNTEKPTPLSDLAIKLDNNTKRILNSLDNSANLIENAYAAKEILPSGILNVGSSIEHSIKIWLDESASNDSQNTTHNSKVVVTATQDSTLEVKEILASYMNETVYLTYKTYGSVDNVSCKYGLTEDNLDQNGTNITKTSCELNPTNPNTTYYYEVCLETSAGLKTCKKESISTEVPSLELGSVTTTKESIEIPFTTNGINTTCRYGTSESDLNSDGTINNNTCTLSSLDVKTRYYYEICTTNALGRSVCKTGDAETKADTYEDAILAGNDPVIKDGLVPVEIGTNGVVKKADTASEWYNYTNKKWANAVILTGADTYKAGDTIPESAIESYFVWIPKYDYKIQSLGSNTTQKAFEIRFSTENTSDSNAGECTTPSAANASGSNYYSGNCSVGDYMTHPAFIHFKDGIKGIWVGKFETTGTISKLTVKPNVTSVRSQTVSAMHNASIAYKVNLNSHMLKNTEWGAVAYLTNSNYGRCTSGSCTEITINSNSSYITGCTNTTTYFSNSVGASTTGNYSGIYDMSGGAWEYVMGAIGTGSSGFSSMPASKYYDKYYTNSSSSTSTGRILGDATAETKSWFSDNAFFVRSSSPWFIRGGSCNDGSNAGLFYFGSNYGSTYSYYGFRLALTE